MSSSRRQVLVVAAGVTVAFAVIVVRLLVDARSAFQNGVAAENRKESGEAIRSYLEAGRLYVPGSPHSRGAIERLDAIATASILASDYVTGRAALEAERAALLGTRSFYTPQAARLPDIERRLARLLAASEERGSLATFEGRAAWHANRLAVRLGPRTPFVLLSLLGMALWVTSTLAFFRTGLNKDLHLVRLPAILASTGFVLGLGVFLVCLRLA